MKRTDISKASTFSYAWPQTLGIMAIRISGAVLALIANMVASRMLGADAFGQYSLFLVWLIVLGYAATAGSGQLICRYIAQYVKAADYEAVSGLIRATLLATTSVAVLLASAGMAIVVWAPLGSDTSNGLLACLALSAVPLVTLQDNLESIARGIDRPALGIGPAFLVRHFAIIAGLSALLILGRDANALVVMSFTVTGLAVSILTQYLLLRRHLRRIMSGGHPRYDLYRWLTTALPMAGTDVMEMLLFNADILILGLFVSPEYVAYYFAATRLAQILTYITYGATAATAQKYACLADGFDRAPLQALIGKVATLSTILTAFAAVLLMLCAAPLLSLFGEGFVQAIPIVGLLALGILISSALGPGDDVLNMLGEERACSLGFLSALTVNIALNFALIPAFGPTGAAIATVSALALRGALLAHFARVRLGLVVPAFISLCFAQKKSLTYET